MQSAQIAKMASHMSGNAEKIAKEKDIEIIPCKFKTQKGIFCIIKHNKFIFIKDDLEEPMRSFVLLHEIGHALLHASQISFFHESDLFDPYRCRLEEEANLFALHILLPDEKLKEYISYGYNTEQIQKITGLELPLIVLKCKDFKERLRQKNS